MKYPSKEALAIRKATLDLIWAIQKAHKKAHKVEPDDETINYLAQEAITLGISELSMTDNKGNYALNIESKRLGL